MINEKEVIESAVKLAERWQNRATELVSDWDREFYIKMNKMLEHPKDKALLIELMDQCFRAESNSRVANQIVFLLEKHGMAHFFTTKDRTLLWLFQNIGKYLPNISVPMFVNQIREDTKTVVLKGEDEPFNKHLKMRREENTRVNINLIGEVVLGEEEASERMEKYLKALANPNIDYISIKISTIFSQISALDFEHTVEVLVEKLSTIYRQAQKYPYIAPDGTKSNKFINLDMEEYRDLAITVEVFKRTLEKEEFKDFYAGIVLQAYLPDSYLWQQKLCDWARKRVEKGGSPIKFRLVKGANMEMEETEASQKHWEMVTYTDKSDTDSNYKRMIRYALQPENAPFMHVGTGSHNLFELAFATQLAQELGTSEYHTIEMLEGMSEPARLAIKEISKSVILYGPTASKEQFTNAIAYLVRRLDENTGPNNFIRYSFGLKVGSKDWKMQEELFRKSFEKEATSFVGAKRKQDRLNEKWADFSHSSYDTKEYHAEADTDFVLPNNQEWARNIVKKWKFSKDIEHKVVPVVVGAEELTENRKIIEAIDKSQLKEGVLAGKFANATAEDLEKAVEVAAADIDGWRSKTHEQRHEVLKQVAIKVRERRDDLIGIAAAEVGKVFTETDVEVSEAVDFLEFYPYSVNYFQKYQNLEFSGKGVGVVVPPWNFPVAIPLGGIAAILAAGNTVIIKPASVAALTAYEMCKCFWDAGVSKNTLQFVPCPGALAGEHLIANKKVDFVILTGGEDTAYKMLETRADLFLTAETGGKDATIVTNMADRDQAVKNVCQSAFGNSGQKCSATSLLVLEEEVYNDKSFKKALIDTARSMSVGSVWDFKNRIGTLANPVSGALKQAISELEEGEEWALEPSYAEDNEYMLKPAIKWGIKEGSFIHKTELFGPVLAVIKANDLRHAVDIVNSTGYGLTSGIESLDEREVAYWKENLKAGNLYINRGTTGAIVLRQPFGGMGKSAIGAGRKVGIFNYITQFVNFEEINTPSVSKKYSTDLTRFIESYKSKTENKEDFEKLSFALQSYYENYENEFSQEKDYCKVRGEDNHFRYLPLNNVLIRVSNDDTLFEVLSRILAARVAKVHFKVSLDENAKVKSFLEEAYSTLFTARDNLVVQDEEKFKKEISKYDRVIFSDISKVSEEVFKEAAKTVTFIVRAKPMMEGRLELLNYFIEQSVSHSYHRYGNIGARDLEK
ncbi:bifunctional proline dehydrogenase/L-glutamate gamma-semialdehyde dehydrogenase [Halarcobacter bivalviorum]|uniref:L-glutamate gamma-semialdehyde dehydrogenase n=1 Tax=Halarcobacter bivalviorum TaxID=663364 RepID=A0AAX2A9D5_9BACT|nr:bifunctional proline dehydrogenase/L-glutamate gamma-semialdehyde dehydrogenase [Halarcobacter bivalviorum]AXH12356.1 proline dehydrogenase / 1-pyrroline-5-carboxylate dehydrogenase [Halarcobacter bivalviorum]RXK10713.1 aldehyde dehydrogenase [Halarcobacter bivalviorum]